MQIESRVVASLPAELKHADPTGPATAGRFQSCLLLCELFHAHGRVQRMGKVKALGCPPYTLRRGAIERPSKKESLVPQQFCKGCNSRDALPDPRDLSRR
eukprot:882389-Amphidinium_carterae.1